MAWREITDVPQEELKKFFGPWARKVWLDLVPAELAHNERREEYRRQFAEKFKATIDEQLPSFMDRRAELPILHVYDGDFMPLLGEARELYMMGYFYSCVITCVVSAEKIARAMFRDHLHVKWPPHDLTDKEMKHLNRLEAHHVANFLVEIEALGKPSCKAFQDLLEVRNQYAHGLGQPSKDAALNAYSLLQKFLDGTVSVAPGGRWHV